MSRETVIALRRFTEKLADALGASFSRGMIPHSPSEPTDANATMGPFVGAGAMGTQTPGVQLYPVTGRDHLLVGDGAYADADATPGMSWRTTTTGLPSPPPPNPYDPNTPQPAGVSNELIDGRLNRGIVQKLFERDPEIMQQVLQYGGGGLLGGLGAYGLARLLQSEEERKKNRFPWLSTLAGTAAGGFLLPALLNNSYVQQAGTAIGNAASGAVDSVKGTVGGKA